MALDKDQIKAWREAYRRHNLEVLEENRGASLEERWNKIFLVEGMRESLGFERSERDDSAIRERWLKAKRRLHG